MHAGGEYTLRLPDRDEANTRIRCLDVNNWTLQKQQHVYTQKTMKNDRCKTQLVAYNSALDVYGWSSSGWVSGTLTLPATRKIDGVGHISK